MGCLKTSQLRLSNSGNSSRNSTPLFASDISPGLGFDPPPIRAVEDKEWCGERKGRWSSRGVSSCVSPAIEYIFDVSIDSAWVIGGKIYGTLEASMLFPVPGGPMSNTLCSPAAAISKAFFAPS